MRVQICVWHPLMDWQPFHSTVLLPLTQCSQDKLWSHCSPDPVKELREDECEWPEIKNNVAQLHLALNHHTLYCTCYEKEPYFMLVRNHVSLALFVAIIVAILRCNIHIVISVCLSTPNHWNPASNDFEGMHHRCKRKMHFFCCCVFF